MPLSDIFFYQPLVIILYHIAIAWKTANFIKDPNILFIYAGDFRSGFAILELFSLSFNCTQICIIVFFFSWELFNTQTQLYLVD